MEQLRAAVDKALFRATQFTFSITRSYYDNIRLDMMSEGYPTGYIEEQLDEFDAEVEPYARALAGKLKF